MHILLKALAALWNEDMSFVVFKTDTDNQCHKECAEPHCVGMCDDFTNVSFYVDGTAVFQGLDFAPAIAFIIGLHFSCNLEYKEESEELHPKIFFFSIARMQFDKKKQKILEPVSKYQMHKTNFLQKQKKDVVHSETLSDI